MEAALKKYNRIGEMMATRNETPMVLGEADLFKVLQDLEKKHSKVKYHM